MHRFLALVRNVSAQFAMVPVLLGACSACHALSPFRPTDNLYFQPGKTAIEGELIDKLDRLRCYASGSPRAVLVLTGHASGHERNANRVAQLRADAAKQWFLENTSMDASMIGAESKGARQFVANDSTREGQAKNRRVELELVDLDGPPPGSRDCRLLKWQSSFLALEHEAAMVFARSLVRSGWVSPPTLFEFARNQKRNDLFDLLKLPKSGISLNREQREEVARIALAFGKVDYFLTWLKTDRPPRASLELGRYFEMACQSDAESSRQIEIVEELRRRGATLPDSQALRCAAEYRSPEVLESFLQAGSRQLITPEIVVQAGRKPQILRQLLQYGADPLSKTSVGTTLFHTMRLNTVADVQQLLDWGLDINAKDPNVPILYALRYASVDVLEYMRQAGADVREVKSIAYGSRNPNAQIWFLRNGLQTVDAIETMSILIREGDAALPVLEEMKNLGIDLDARNSIGQNMLAIAIRNYSPKIVQFLVDSGVDRQVVEMTYGTSRTAIEVAENLSELMISVCISGTFCPPSDRIDSDRQHRKQQIVQILKTTASSQ